MSILGKVRKLLFRLIPNSIIWILQKETADKVSQHQKRLIKSHGKNFYLASNVIIHGPSQFACGDNCAINEFVHIRAGGSLTIGNGVWIANHSSLITETHPSDVECIADHPSVFRPIIIDDNVWIGAHATILPGVTLGKSCIVGAGSVVTKDVPPYAIVTGIPAKVLRYKSLNFETANTYGKN